MLPVLKSAALGETSVPKTESFIAAELGLAQEDIDKLLPSGRQRLLANRIHWAKFYMLKAGLISSPRRGHFIVSERGKVLLATNPHRIDVDRLSEYPEFLAFYNGEKGDPTPTSPAAPLGTDVPVSVRTPDDEIEAAYSTLTNALRKELLDRILSNSPAFFEQVIVELLVAMGYGGSYKDAATQLGRTGDGGVDGVINEDRLGLDRIYVQAKRYKPENCIGRPNVNGFVGSLVGFGATKGVFVTTSNFSQQAKDFVKHLPQRVILINGAELADLMIEHNVGVRAHRTISVKRLDEDFFSEEN